MVDRLAAQSGEAPVAPAVELQHIELLFEQLDERQEPLALQTMLVERVRGAVRGRDDDHSGVEQRANKRSRIIASAMSSTWNSSTHSNVASAARSLATLAMGQSVWARRSRSIRSWTSSMKAWKCTRRLCGIGTERKNRSISIDLPRPDRPAEIKPDRSVTTAILGKAEAGEPAAKTGLGPVMQQRAIEALQPLDSQLLRGIGLQQPAPAQRSVGRRRLVDGRRRSARIGCHDDKTRVIAVIDGQMFRV